LPEVALQEGAPNKHVKITDIFAGKKGVLLGVPGAFTPTCSNSHLPGFIKNIEQVRSKGYDVVACVTVNDAFVTQAWAEKQNAEGKVRLLADPNAEFTKVIKKSKFRILISSSIDLKCFF
jgi:2-Cys peroxiredoxin 5